MFLHDLSILLKKSCHDLISNPRITNSLAYETRRFNVSFTRAFLYPSPHPKLSNCIYKYFFISRPTRSAYVFCAVNSAVLTMLEIVRGEQFVWLNFVLSSPHGSDIQPLHIMRNLFIITSIISGEKLRMVEKRLQKEMSYNCIRERKRTCQKRFILWQLWNVNF